MKRKMTAAETVMITSMLFGMFFGAGNLIFPVHVGQMAGSNAIKAAIGLLITGVGLPLLGVAALGMSKSSGLFELSSNVGKKYGYFFTCLLYLTIGPFFAIPRCASTSFTIGISPIIGNVSQTIPLAIFTLIFFAAVLYFSLWPGKILTWIGKILNPVFLIFLAVLCITALISPAGAISNAAPMGDYANSAFFKGFLEGYNTMDALAGLAFGIVVVNVIKEMGIAEPDAIAKNTVKAGTFSCLLMGAIYLVTTIVGAQSRGVFEPAENGGIALGLIADHYFGTWGAVILAVTVTFACLKTAVGLVTSCSEAFVNMFPKGPGYKAWAIIISVFSFAISNVGLTAIIDYSIPVLMFLYPLSITLILVSLFGGRFKKDSAVLKSITAFTFIAALADFFGALPKDVISVLHIGRILEKVNSVLPFSDLGLGWLCPALVGLVIGIGISLTRKTNN